MKQTTGPYLSRILFDKIKAQYDILRQAASYVMAEHQLMAAEDRAWEERNSGVSKADGIRLGDNVKSISFESSINPEAQFMMDQFGNIQHLSEKDNLLAKAQEVRRQLDEAIDKEDYVKASMLQRTLDTIEIKYNKL